MLQFYLRVSAAGKGRKGWMVQVLSMMMLVNHYVLIVFGGMEMYYAGTTWFYNVFCTLLFVTDPILIFIPTVILQHLFAVQANRK